MSPFAPSLLGSPAFASASAGVLSWLATYLLHSTILLGLAWALSRQFRGRHPLGEQAIWRAALFGSILTATLQIATGWQPLGGALTFPTGPALANAPSAVSAEPAVSGDAPVTTLSLRTSPDHSAPAASERVVEAATSSPAILSSPVPWTWLAFAWGLVAAGLLIRWGAAHAALSRRLRPRLEVIDGTLFRSLRRLRAEAGFDSAVRLTCAHRLSVPIALGLTHPEICLPPRALSHLDEREAESLLAHELAHLARRDPAALNLTQVAASLFFFQPLVWLARRKLYDLSELLADDWAIGRTGRPLSLARCLAEVACWSVHERRLPVPSMAESSSPLGLRIRRLLGEIRPSRRLPVWALPVCGLVLVAFAAVAPAVSARGKDEPKGAPIASQEEAVKAEADRDRDDFGDRNERDEYRRPQPPETYVHESPRADEVPPVFSEDEERLLGEHAEELAAQLSDMGKGWDSEEFGRDMEKFGHDFKMSAEDRAKLEGEIDAMVARMIPDRQALGRLTARAAKLADLNLPREERERIVAEIRRSAEEMRPSEAEIAEIQRHAREMAPSAEEARRMAEDARRFAATHRPSEEEMRKIREQSRKYEQEVRRIVEQHRGEIEKVQREMQQKLEEMQERLQEDIERSLGGDEQGLRDQANRGNHPPRVPRTPRPPRPAVAPAPEAPPAPGTPASPPRVALAPLPPAAPSPHSFPVPRVAPAPGVPAAPPAPRAAPVVAPAPPGRPAPAPRALPAPAPEAPEVVEPPEPGEPAEAPEAAETPEPPPVHVR